MLREMVIGALAAGALIGCASSPRVGTTSLTAADAPAAAETPAPAEQAAEPAAELARPEGDRVCRSQNEHGTTELFLTWNGKAARGTLRTVAPSGAVTEKKVHAQRDGKTIVVHDIWETDIVVHAAVLKEESGKKHILLSDWSSAATCD